MNLEILLQHFGYPVIILGTLLEGETILIIAGFAAHQGYLSLPAVIACAFTGSFIGDQIFFFIGRKKGLSYFNKRPKAKEKIKKFQNLLNRYNTIIILCFRFMYGLRTVAPFTIGLSYISTKRFFVLNSVSAFAWAAAIGYLGYFFGQAFEILLEDVKKYETIIIIGGILILIVHLIYRYVKSKKNSPVPPAE